MISSRRSFLLGSLAAPGLAAAARSSAFAQGNWPSGIISLVAPAPAGGSLDILARLFQPDLQQRLGATVIVENRSGGGTSLGAAFVGKAPRDGTKWLINADPQFLNPSLLVSLPYDWQNDLDPILLLGTSPNVLAAGPDTPYRTLSEVLDAARRPAGVNLAVLIDTLGHVSMVLLGKLAKANLTAVTYRGAPQALNDVIGGHVPLIAGSASLLAPYLADGKLRGIAQTGTERLPALKDIPTVRESGFPDFSAPSFWGFYAPSKTPSAMVDRFVSELMSIVKRPDMQSKLSTTMLLDVTLAGPDEFRKFFYEQVAKWRSVILENNLQHT
ncbi:Bug family tripartite tricarboxylate transporter substrate binding protein [Rhodoplanes sp. Z2-YC6860]|uniref:Bug family tripartite tricarboxylate transporter substrate binding protein n=1 Tax=Rhodoplanes sp. Z2-YC6860 TaxID=674703 RepID=UPI00078B25D1|nr:tripartite tricarboxylate transporter substrate-binding protein [Rhodoplanes sp. Z2-YC6860]AMN44352.1 extra-cytoplasmic solute receptor protein [Rhodoplanes sp. Z2-YC6860]